MTDWRELLGELERQARPESWDDRAPFRETFLAQMADPRQRAGLRDFGRLLAFLAAEAPGSSSTPADGWRSGLAAALADLRFDACQLAALCRDFLATEPERSARHRRARAAGELALELARAAERLEALTARRRRTARAIGELVEER
jgi:hypothetical protein